MSNRIAIAPAANSGSAIIPSRVIQEEVECAPRFADLEPDHEKSAGDKKETDQRRRKVGQAGVKSDRGPQEKPGTGSAANKVACGPGIPEMLQSR
jgi:hypothetical protein